MNEDVDDPSLDGEDHPYNINIGAIRAGDWASSVPAIARLAVRIGHPTAWTPGEAEEHVRSAIRDATRDDRWLVEHPPSIRQTGFRAQGYSLAADEFRSRSRSPMPTRRRTANAPTRSGWEVPPTLGTT